MNLIDPKLAAYAEAHTTEECAVLKNNNRETHAKVLLPHMLSGHLQGQVLKMFSHMVQPHQVLEIGTFTGYSAICLAAGLQEGGLVHTIDINEELNDMVTRSVEEAGLSGKIKTYIGDASEIIPAMKNQFDLVFIDADKHNYPVYYALVFDKVKIGGYIIADNVLRRGNVVQELSDMDKDTRILHEFNEMVQQDERVENVLLPIRDGLMIARKIKIN